MIIVLLALLFYCIVVVSWMCACVLRRGKHAKFLLHKLEDSILHNLDKDNVNRWLFSRYDIILLQIKQQLDWTKRYQTIHFKIDICCFLAKQATSLLIDCEWINMSNFQWARTIKPTQHDVLVQSKHNKLPIRH